MTRLQSQSATVVAGILGLAIAACGGDDGGGAADATVGGDLDAADIACAHGSGANVVYLNFEGATLSPGPDATMDQAPMMPTTLTFPPFREGDAGRDAAMSAIVADVCATLAPYDIEVVTSRPSSGAYDMMVIGGTSDDALLGPGYAAVGFPDCDDEQISHAALIFDTVDESPSSAEVVHNYTILMLGLSHAIPTSGLHSDCMCIAPPACDETKCVLHDTSVPASSTNPICGLVDPFVPTEAFEAEFGVRSL